MCTWINTVFTMLHTMSGLRHNVRSSANTWIIILSMHNAIWILSSTYSYTIQGSRILKQHRCSTFTPIIIIIILTIIFHCCKMSFGDTICPNGNVQSTKVQYETDTQYGICQKLIAGFDSSVWIWNKFCKVHYKILIKSCCKLVFDAIHCSAIRKLENVIFKSAFIINCWYVMPHLNWK